VPGVCDALVLRSALDGGTADRNYKLVGPASTQIAIDSVGTPAGAPLALFFNLGSDALACGSLGYLGASWSVLDDFQALLGVTVPAGQPISISSVGGGRVTIPTSSLPAGFAQALRVQGLWLDARVPLPYVPLLATNEVELGIDLRPPLGVQVATSGGNSFNADPSSGFFSVTNPTTQPITRIRFEAVGGMVFDFAQVGMADRFDGGNSTASGCRGTFRGGSDAAAGVDYAANPVSPCDPTARQGHEGRVEVGVHHEVHQGPVVEPGALEVAILELEAQGLHQVQARSRGRGQARGAAGVVRDLGVDEDDLHGRVS
jgi:hypothetical protein